MAQPSQSFLRSLRPSVVRDLGEWISHELTLSVCPHHQGRPRMIRYAETAATQCSTASSQESFTRLADRQGFCAPDFANISDIIDSAELFKQILSNPNHVLALLPDKTESHYSRPHDRQLIPKLTKV